MICFFDTNVLVYALDSHEVHKQALAIACFSRAIHEHTVTLSTQVLQEFYSITTRKLRPALTAAEAEQRVRHLGAFDVMGHGSQHIIAAIELVQKHQLQWWDALILEAALRAKAEGMPVIAVTSLQHSSAVTSKHPCGKRLFEVADVVIPFAVQRGIAE